MGDPLIDEISDSLLGQPAKVEEPSMDVPVVDEPKKPDELADMLSESLVGSSMDNLPEVIQPQKVPRVIGKSGSMITLLKKYTNCWIFVGQNGRIWVKGDPKGIDLIVEAIKKIEKEAHTVGLTNRIEKLLKEGQK